MADARGIYADIEKEQSVILPCRASRTGPVPWRSTFPEQRDFQAPAQCHASSPTPKKPIEMLNIYIYNDERPVS